MNKRIVWLGAVVIAAVFLWLFPPFEIRSRAEVELTRIGAQFNAQEFVSKFWNEYLEKSFDRAADASAVLTAVADNRQKAREKYGRTVGISSTYCFYLRGTARVVEITSDRIGLVVNGSGDEPDVVVPLGLAVLGILIYVAFRFEVGFGVGAVVSTIHDILMTIGIFVLFDRQFTAPMVAAILLIAGYSINDTIVVFDRIREELKSNPDMKLRDVINHAINRVFVRSLLTSATTFLASLALFMYGGGVINDLAFTFLVGVITGTFSSIFIASPIFFWWHKGDRKHVERHQDVKPTYEWTGSSRASE